MKITVNTRLLLPNRLEGIGWFAYETLKRITREHPEHEFIFIFDRPFSEEFIFSENITPIIVNPPSRHPFLWYLFFEWGVPMALKKYKTDVFLSPDGWVPTKLPCPIIDVIHDLNFVHLKNFASPLVQWYYNKYFPVFARNSKRIATVSEYSKQDIASSYNVPLDKIDVVYNGANELYKPVEESVKSEIRNKYTQGAPFFIFVGAIHQRKNIANLFKAFDIFKNSANSNTKLLLVGSMKNSGKEIENTYQSMQWKNDVVFVNRLEPDELNKVLASALALLYVSFFEGFGIPILEAFNVEAPVITSNITSMPEVAQDAALYVEPYSVDSIAQAMVEISRNENLRNDLIEKGKKRRNDFSWDKSAKALWECIEKTVNNPS